jgi:hypothetical protein
MLHRSGYIIVATSAVLALAYCLAGVEATPATARAPKVDPINVNRVLKGDRLPGATTGSIPPAPVKIQAPVRLPAGCEAIVSVITRSPLAQVAGNCVS